ncbi:MAG: winged helix-turn-helix domain-containing protein [Candidatus Bathyarchaeota archaeon]
MISKKRSKIDIIVDALEVTQKNTTKTNLILRLNIGWRKGEKIFKLLLSKGLIIKNDAHYGYSINIYSITQEGIIFLEHYNEIKNTIDYEIVDRYQTQ